MTKSEAGKLGAIGSVNIKKQMCLNRILKYNESPSSCKECDTIFVYDKRHASFCNRSCSATFNNKNRVKKPKRLCNYCSKALVNNNKYCNNRCQQDKQFYAQVELYESGQMLNLGVSTMKRYLTERVGYQCNRCSLTEWNNKPIVLDLEHIDGNSDNGEYKNLCLLCPNCHSQTPTYKGKNRGNGRHYRRQRYKDQKSY